MPKTKNQRALSCCGLLQRLARSSAMRDRERLDASLVLFALWHSRSARSRLERRNLAAADRAACAIRSGVVRCFLRRLRSYPYPDIRCAGRRRQEAVELEVEETAPQRGHRCAERGWGRSGSASANLALCLGSAVPSVEATLIRDQLAVFVAEH